MPNWTKEQLEAINKDGTNIIVSAGAGSGKTAVLSERVIRKLLDGVSIDDLLILTFTNAAALEMKERIRKKIKENISLSDELDKLDSAYITTFDSFALSIVKKYHYLLNLPSNIQICEQSIIDLKKEQLLDEIMEDYYSSNNIKFKKLINDFCVKDDNEIKNYILNINNKLDMLYDKKIYLKDYIKSFYNDSFIDKKISEYEDLLFSKISQISKLLNNLEDYVDSDYYEEIKLSLEELLISDSYLKIKDNLEIKLKNLPNGSELKAKSIKSEMAELLKELKELCIYENINEIKNGILKTKDYIDIIIEIILKLDNEINEYKNLNNLYEFVDIAMFAIKIVEGNEEIRYELKDKFNEIMIDEYQDTNDLQDLFISYIENNNVYMVGDIKQSIYRFRNANPNLFQIKYTDYSKNRNGIKIDLNKNFRSRKEVLNDINLAFNYIMDEEIGGADYINNHQMIYGNSIYDEIGYNDQNNDLELKLYDYDKNLKYTKDEIEIFIIANDIQNKVNSHYQVYDDDIKCNRDINYSDFSILMDRANKFDLYKKIFEYMHIPLTLYKDETIIDNDNLKIIKNIIRLIIKYYENNYDKEFEYSYISVLRSYLFKIDDDKIFDSIVSKKYNSLLIEKLENLIVNLNDKNIYELTIEMIDEFDFYSNLIKTNNILNSINVIEYILNISNSLSNIGYTIYDFYDYLQNVIEKKMDIKFSLNTEDSNSVKIMTIHKSKGLEFPICYYSGLSSKFNISDLKDKFIYDSRYGIISPFIDNGIRQTIYKDLLKNSYLKDEISEKIRLFYVALTRAKEKMIIVAPGNDLDFENIYDSTKRLKYTCFLDIISSIIEKLSNKIVKVNTDSLNLTKDYDKNLHVDYQSLINLVDEKIIVDEVNFDNELILNKHYSKENKKLYNQEIINSIEYGKKLHKLFEDFDFLNPNDCLDIKDKSIIDNFINTGIFDDAINIYKEYEFIDYDDFNEIHGFIDLIIEYSDEIKIVDYKLKNISDDAYLEQLNGYKKYIEKISDKRVSIYLYSIIDGVLEQL